MASKSLDENVHQAGATEPVKKTSFFYNLVLQSFSLLWIPPVVAVLFLNFRGWVIGASLACGIRKCDAAYWDSNQNQAHINEDRNIQGALQLVAKGVGIWFTVIAGGLVYDITMFLVATRDGLPISYLSIPLFLSPGTLLDKSFWVNWNWRPVTKEDLKIWGSWMPGLFALFIVVMLLATSLMGPATALLLLPTMGWKAVTENPPQSTRSNTSGR